MCRPSALTLFRVDFLKSQQAAGRKINPATSVFHEEVKEAFSELSEERRAYYANQSRMMPSAPRKPTQARTQRAPVAVLDVAAAPETAAPLGLEKFSPMLWLASVGPRQLSCRRDENNSGPIATQPLSPELLEESRRRSWRGDDVPRVSIKKARTEMRAILNSLGHASQHRISNLPRLPREGSECFAEPTLQGQREAFADNLVVDLIDACAKESR